MFFPCSKAYLFENYVKQKSYAVILCEKIVIKFSSIGL